MSLAAGLPIEQLAQRCAEETANFNRRQSSDTQFCFELLHRALAEDIREAFAAAYRIYERQVSNWVYSHSGFAQTGESADYFARGALTAFYFALRGSKFERFPTLERVLSYLKLCVHTTIAQYLRDQGPANPSLEQSPAPEHTPDMHSRVDAAELWTYICSLLTDERDQTLARCTFVLGMKPRQIVERFPGVWLNEREVSVALYRIRKRLRDDEELRQRKE